MPTTSPALVPSLSKPIALGNHRRRPVRADLQLLTPPQLENLAQPLADQAFAGRLDRRSIASLLYVIAELLDRANA